MSADNVIARLRRVPLRDVWKHEAHDFTQWMEQNIDVLNDVLDINLVNIERERRTESSFSIDLVAEDENGATVVVENQLGKSDHDHLGKLITYLSATSATAAIWIVSKPRPEHIAAISWLNEAHLKRFYLLQIEAVKIGDSPPAPLLTAIVVPPEDFQPSSGELGGDTERYHIRLEWWNRLTKHENAKLHAHITPGTYAWIGTSIGVRGLSLNYTVRQNDCGVELYIDRGKDCDAINRAIFDHLQASQTEIEGAFSGVLEWQALEAKRACRIKATLVGGYRTDQEEWSAIHDRQVMAMTELNRALEAPLRKLDIKAIEQRVAIERDQD